VGLSAKDSASNCDGFVAEELDSISDKVSVATGYLCDSKIK